jgi:hypothetical protein
MGEEGEHLGTGEFFLFVFVLFSRTNTMEWKERKEVNEEEKNKIKWAIVIGRFSSIGLEHGITVLFIMKPPSVLSFRARKHGTAKNKNPKQKKPRAPFPCVSLTVNIGILLKKSTNI